MVIPTHDASAHTHYLNLIVKEHAGSPRQGREIICYPRLIIQALNDPAAWFVAVSRPAEATEARHYTQL